MAALGLCCFAWAFSSWGEWGCSSLRASHCGGFSCGAQALGPWASAVAAAGL